MKKYIGDGVYIEMEPNGMIVLTTEEGDGLPTNTIYLEPEVYTELFTFIETVRRLNGQT